ncbi:hypothetical protein PI124_g8247 [Phytophthora idaei]|nr:hypothetical protein PI125_g16189 [Phytophthora idaei]KAG3148869.1 hypothetical protein PI126_g12274 [Phytophthora idaei]KAG3247041.1 hypothetical protein PI124_g8247 [Phytophthora idaei]
MPTIGQLRAEIDWLNQAMADRTRVPSNLPKYTGKRGEDVREWLFQIENAYRINNIPIEDASSRLPGIAGSAIEKPASGWFLHRSSTTREEEHTWGIFREHVLQHFEASNYQSVLREKLQRLKQTADIETYNGEYSALIFRVEGMSVLDQVICYANGLKPRIRSYVKLENPETLSEAMDLAVKYEVTHFVDEVRDRQARQDKRKSLVEQGSSRRSHSRGYPSTAKGDLSRDPIPSELETVPVSTASSLVTSRPTAFSGRRSKGTRETGNHVSERGSCRGRERSQNC